jgi:dTDP-4-amino-4,6-dideoxygalactose transaminase
MNDIRPLLVSVSGDLGSVLRRLEETSKGIVLLVDAQGKLLRTVTDGDVRRQLLEGAALTQPLSELPPRASATLRTPCSGAQALLAMNTHQVNQLPVLDATGCPVQLLLRRELESQILLSTPHLGDSEMGYVEEAFRTNWIAPLGPNVDAFEKELAAWVGVRHAAALSSGTAAIHVALRLLNIGPGDEVFCSSLTFVASANPILYEKATPVFIDSDPATWNMSVPALQRALEDRRAKGRLPKAVVVVSLYGQSADMAPIMELCDAMGVPVVEDAAESLGATYRSKASGSFGKLGVYSFNGNKIITTSGGGMLVSEDESLIKRARHLSTQAREAAPYYEHTEVGYNYRMSNVLAGIGRGQLKVLEQRVAARRRVFERYKETLADLPQITWMPEASYGRSNRWLTACTLDRGISPASLIERLAEDNIEARRVWKPMHLQPLFAGAEYFTHAAGQDIAGDLFSRGVCLPSGSNITDEELERVHEAMRRFLRSA